MKKMLFCFTIIVVSLVLAACSIEAIPQEENVLRDMIAEFEMPPMIENDLDLPDTLGDAFITWRSSNVNVLGNDGMVIRPLYHEGDELVVLTATFELGNATLIRRFDVVVKAFSEDISDWLIWADSFADEFDLDYDEVTEDLVLPNTYQGMPLEWSSSHPATLTKEGHVTRPLYFTGHVTVTLTAEASMMVNGDAYDAIRTFTVIVLPLDEAASIAKVRMDIEDYIEEYFQTIGDVTGDISLPNKLFDYDLRWETSDYLLIDQRGYVHPPLFNDGSKEVTLSTEFKIGTVWYALSYDFDLTVLPRDEKVVTSTVTLPFTNLATEYIVEAGTLDVHYMNNEHLPYVDIASFIHLIDGAIVTDEIEIIIEGNVITVRYVYVHEEEEEENGENGEPAENGDEPELETTVYELIADFDANLVTVNRYGFFSAIAQATQTDFGQNLYTIDYVYNASDPVVFDLGHYRFELVKHGDAFLMPLHLANLFFTGSMFDVYYNKASLYGVDTYQLSYQSPTVNTINSGAPYGEVPYDLLEMNYHFMAFSFDYFYGLKIATEVESYYEIFAARKGQLFGTTNQHYTAIKRAAYDLDDLHTSHLTNGYYIRNRDFDGSVRLEWFGPRMSRFYYTYFYSDIGDYCDAYQSIRYLDDDTIAIIQINGFTADTPDEFKAMLLEVEAKGTVEKVVIDLACNTGGIIGTMLQVIGYMTDEPIPYHSMNAGDLSSSTTLVGTDTEAFDFEWYVLTSPITYSAANLMTHITKEMGIATIIGQQSSGGASSITTNLMPSGSIIIMSSPMVLADAYYESLEMGIPVDVEIEGDYMVLPAYILQAVKYGEVVYPE